VQTLGFTQHIAVPVLSAVVHRHNCYQRQEEERAHKADGEQSGTGYTAEQRGQRRLVYRSEVGGSSPTLTQIVRGHAKAIGQRSIDHVLIFRKSTAHTYT
jgi:hypothetical protein